MPDVASATRTRTPQSQHVVRHRVTFQKIGDARFLSHRNTMDAFERAIRAAGLPARYSEGFNPHMRLSMGPALPLGLESLHEVFDVDGNAPFEAAAAARINEKLPAGLRALNVNELSPAEPPLSKAIKSARYAVRLDSPEQIGRASEALANGWRDAVPALRSLTLDAELGATRLRFEVNLDQSAGPTATAKKVLETLLSIPPEAQASLSITREATVLA